MVSANSYVVAVVYVSVVSSTVVVCLDDSVVVFDVVVCACVSLVCDVVEVVVAVGLVVVVVIGCVVVIEHVVVFSSFVVVIYVVDSSVALASLSCSRLTVFATAHHTNTLSMKMQIAATIMPILSVPIFLS